MYNFNFYLNYLGENIKQIINLMKIFNNLNNLENLNRKIR